MVHTAMAKSLKKHLEEARAARWKKATPEQRKAHSSKMNEARWGKKPPAKSPDGSENSFQEIPLEI